jgi:hypothetical protein
MGWAAVVVVVIVVVLQCCFVVAVSRSINANEIVAPCFPMLRSNDLPPKKKFLVE